MTTTYAKIIADSISDHGIRLSTLELRYPLIVHAQAKTHRIIRWVDNDQYDLVLKQDVDFMSDPMLSRNAASNRAIPIRKILDQIDSDAFYPSYWGRNQPGMQADETLSNQDVREAEAVCERGIRDAISCAEKLSAIGLHKQIINRVVMPYQYITVIVTATEWDNFFKLRLAHDAQPEIQELAKCIKEALDNSTPKILKPGHWHLPYVLKEEINLFTPEILTKLSVARCARVSYLNHDNSSPNVEKDITLHDKLLEAGHMSPLEHQLTPMLSNKLTDFDLDNLEKGVTHVDRKGNLWSGNMRGWIPYRQLI